jgi:hypothetical protein
LGTWRAKVSRRSAPEVLAKETRPRRRHRRPSHHGGARFSPESTTGAKVRTPEGTRRLAAAPGAERWKRRQSAPCRRQSTAARVGFGSSERPRRAGGGSGGRVLGPASNRSAGAFGVEKRARGGSAALSKAMKRWRRAGGEPQARSFGLHSGRDVGHDGQLGLAARAPWAGSWTGRGARPICTADPFEAGRTDGPSAGSDPDVGELVAQSTSNRRSSPPGPALGGLNRPAQRSPGELDG